MIQTERLLLRAWRDQDLAPFARINGDPEVLDPAYCGRGLATEPAAAVLKEGFGLLGLSRVISIIHKDNIASRRVAEKIGLRLWREAEHPRPDTGQPLPICVYATSR